VQLWLWPLLWLRAKSKRKVLKSQKIGTFLIKIKTPVSS